MTTPMTTEPTLYTHTCLLPISDGVEIKAHTGMAPYGIIPLKNGGVGGGKRRTYGAWHWEDIRT